MNKYDKNKQAMSLLVESSMEAPHGWDKGFEYPHELMTGEAPFKHRDNWYLYIWNTDDSGKKDIAVYNFGTDIVEDYADFQAMMQGDVGNVPEA